MFRTPPNIVIPALYEENGEHPHTLCPVQALKHWLDLSAEWKSDAVFLNPNSFKPMNKGSIAQSLVRTINLAIPGVFAKAHDVRKISASIAWTRGVSPFEITKRLFWASSSTFIAKYLIPLKTKARRCVAAGST